MEKDPNADFSIADDITSPQNPDGTPVYPGTIGGSTGDGVPGAAAIVINWGAFQNNQRQGQFLVLLHEMAHFFDVRGFSPNDISPGLQFSNNSQVYKNCDKTLDR